MATEPFVDAAPAPQPGAVRYCVNAGGDVVVGSGVDAAPWRLGVRHPSRRGMLCAVVELTDGAMATSGRYERGDHILDGRTGRPATGLLSVTVVASTLTEADARQRVFRTTGFSAGMEIA